MHNLTVTQEKLIWGFIDAALESLGLLKALTVIRMNARSMFFKQNFTAGEIISSFNMQVLKRHSWRKGSYMLVKG